MVKYALFELVKSMTMSEKRYFKIYSSKHVIGQSNDYVLLFDLGDFQITVNELVTDKVRFPPAPLSEFFKKHFIFRMNITNKFYLPL